ncbi:MAG: precorrin methylase [Euryarchaeota archaeon]|nr:precorrin methylase [Euryarchaeota archaeon]
MRKHFIIGCGFRQYASIESFESALSKTPKTEYYSGICVPEDKMSHKALCAFAKKLHLPIYGVKSDVISGTDTPTKSSKIMNIRHTGSVAEAAALAIFKTPARLISTRAISDDRQAVCAIAMGVDL